MARGRMINQTIDYDAEFNALSIEAQLMYLRTLAFLDRDGLIFGHPRALLAKVAPLLEFTQGQMLDFIDEWLDQGLVIRYTAKVGDVLFFKGFAKNQSGMHYDRESPSRFDPPPGYTHGPKGLTLIESAPTPEEVQPSGESESSNPPSEPMDAVQNDSGTTPAEVRTNSGGTPTQIEVKDQIELKEKLRDEDEDACVREHLDSAWWDAYESEMPPKVRELMPGLVAGCGEEAVLYAIQAAADAKSRTFSYIAKTARNYVPLPVPNPQISNYANGNGAYHVDIPGVVLMQPPPQVAPPKPLPAPLAHDDPWAIALAELAPTLPATAASYLAGSHMERGPDLAGIQLYRIVVEPKAAVYVQWLNTQVKSVIRKTLKSIVGPKIEIEIVAAETEPVP